ncbi:MAG: hypothetical protein R8G66_03510 [Cytophagales bacterium]|nr:hypothetical protein [Cytophagales bacterium]
MPHILQNQHLSLHIDLPEENYQLSRFDWTGKITRFTFNRQNMTGHELPDSQIPNQGVGLYNEFGIDQPVGFEETAIGDWFHKIGVGLLRKENSTYDFKQPYPIKSAIFQVHPKEDELAIVCYSDAYCGFAYILKKVIRLETDGFSIHYKLMNKGVKPIITNEYVHNFMAFDGQPIDPSHALYLPFKTAPSLFLETVNPEGLVNIGERDISFLGRPKEPFFFSNLSGGKSVEASWTLVNKAQKLSLSETGNFKTSAVNLWGWGHVISPELFFQIDLAPGNVVSWSRRYLVASHRDSVT